MFGFNEPAIMNRIVNTGGTLSKLSDNITRDRLHVTIINLEWNRDVEVKNHFTVLSRAFEVVWFIIFYDKIYGTFKNLYGFKR